MLTTPVDSSTHPTQMCKMCPPGTYWPYASGLETDTCIPCNGARRQLTTNKTHPATAKWGSTMCPAYPSRPAKPNAAHA